jgi:hypothetical protein
MGQGIVGQGIEMKFSEWSSAEERGRRMAASKLASDTERRKVVEAAYGEGYCRRRYPEAYTKERFQ